MGNGVNQHIPNLDMGGRRPDSRLGHLTPREVASVTHYIVGCVGPIANLDALGEDEKFLSLLFIEFPLFSHPVLKLVTLQAWK